MDLDRRAQLVRDCRRELKQAVLTRRERRRERDVEKDIAARPAVSGNSRPALYAAAMRRTVRGHGINRPRGAIRAIGANLANAAYHASALDASPAELDRQGYLRRARLASNRAALRRRRRTP